MIKKRYLLLLIITGFMCIMQPVFSYWIIGFDNPLDQPDAVIETIGEWIYQSKKYDPNASYQKGDIVIMDDGRYFTVINDVDPGNTHHHPDNPSDSWWESTKYQESTREYRGFNYYGPKWAWSSYDGDYAIWNNEVYEYTHWVQHNPNTTTQKSPPHWYWKRRADLDSEVEHLYYRHIVYVKDDVVRVNNVWYRSLKMGHSEKFPPDSSEYWQAFTP